MKTGGSLTSSSVTCGGDAVNDTGQVETGREDYVRRFRAHVPVEADRAVGQDTALVALDEAVTAWRSGAEIGGVAVIGGTGSGAPQVLAGLGARLGSGATCATVALDRYDVLHDGLAAALGRSLGCGRVVSADELISCLGDTERRVVVLEGCHNLFVRRVGGFAALYDLHHLMSATRGRILWICSWNPFTWYYLDRTLGLARYFDRVLRFGPVPLAAVESWIRARHDATGYTLDLPGLGTEPDGPWLPGPLRTGLERGAAGDLDVAESLWLRSVEHVTPALQRVTVPRLLPFDGGKLSDVRRDELYMLCSLLYHRDILLDYAAEDMNLDPIDARCYLDHLVSRGIALASAPGGRYRIDPLAEPAVVGLLIRKNLMAGGARGS